MWPFIFSGTYPFLFRIPYDHRSGQVSQAVDHGHAHIVESVDTGYKTHDFQRESQAFQQDGQDDQHTAGHGAAAGGEDQAQDQHFQHQSQIQRSTNGLGRHNKYRGQADAGSVFIDLCTQIGVIGLVGSSREQKLHILENETLFLELIEQIADFISVKAMERERALQREALLSTLNATLEHIQQGILILGKDFRVTDCNRAAMEQLETPNLAGERIFLEATGDNLAKYTEYSLTALGRQYRLMGTYLPVPQPTRDYQSVLIFYRSREIKERYFETAALPAVDKTSILGSSPATLKLKEEISKVARSTSTVLITGESGTGKEMVATSIWRESDRRDKRFIALNCAAIPESIMESELFGYVKGAFTGADPNGRMGKFELANEGVIFLDEIGDMPLYLQSKLLRVLQERKIVRIGSNQLMDIDVRVIAATNKDLKKMVREKRFREDLYYRLDVIPLRVAPLRERLEDIEDLTLFYSQRFARKFGKKAPRLTEEVMDALKGYRWPGNVRELENAVEYMVNLMGEDGTLDVSMLPEDIRTGSREAAAPTENGPGKQTGAGQILSLRELEKNAIRQALLQCGNHTAGKAMAARKLGIGMATLYRKIQQYGL